MKPHIDRYGREWNFKPGHDPDQMLQIDLDLLDRFLRLDWKAKGVLKPDDDVMPWERYQKLDAYLLKLKTGWYAGVRYGDEPHQYFSPYFSKEVMDLMLLSRTPCDHREHDAWVELVGRWP
jgi:hypothetical protein